MAQHEPTLNQWAAGWYTGKTVFVTGGTSGIGAAIGRGFIEAGAKLVSTGVSDAEIEAAGRDPVLATARLERLDVRDRAAVERLVFDLPSLDVVINCAGIIRRDAELDPDVFSDVVDINLTGSMRVCAAARPKLRESRGSIVNLASMLSFFGGGLVPGYSASKGGIAQMTKSLAIAYAQDGIRVNAIAPGWIETPLTQELQQNDARRSAIINRTPLKRWGRPEDVVGGVLFLCSPAAGFITGTILPIDGGYLIT